MRNPKKIAVMVALFLGSFLFFIYMSFPYGVLKESIASQVLASTGITIRMESFGPAFPIGFAADNVEVYKGQSSHLKIQSLTARLSLLQLVMARLGVSISAEDQKGGDLNLGVGFGFFDLLTGNVSLPSYLSLSAKSFPVDSVVSFAIQSAVDSGVGGPLAGPLLGKLGLKGKLNGNATLNLMPKNPSQSSGDIKISLLEAVLVLSDPSLNFPDQSFKTAQITGKLVNGTLTIDPATRLTTADLDMGVDGKVVLRPSMANSSLSLKTFVKLQGLLGEQYGMLIDGLSNGLGKNGSLNLQIGGTVGTPQMTSL